MDHNEVTENVGTQDSQKPPAMSTTHLLSKLVGLKNLLHRVFPDKGPQEQTATAATTGTDKILSYKQQIDFFCSKLKKEKQLRERALLDDILCLDSDCPDEVSLVNLRLADYDDRSSDEQSQLATERGGENHQGGDLKVLVDGQYVDYPFRPTPMPASKTPPSQSGTLSRSRSPPMTSKVTTDRTRTLAAKNKGPLSPRFSRKAACGLDCCSVDMAVNQIRQLGASPKPKAKAKKGKRRRRRAPGKKRKRKPKAAQPQDASNAQMNSEELDAAAKLISSANGGNGDVSALQRDHNDGGAKKDHLKVLFDGHYADRPVEPTPAPRPTSKSPASRSRRSFSRNNSPACRSKSPSQGAGCSKRLMSRSKSPAARSRNLLSRSKSPAARSRNLPSRSKSPVARSRVLISRSKSPAAQSRNLLSKSKNPAVRSKSPASRNKIALSRSKSPMARSKSPFSRRKTQGSSRPGSTSRQERGRSSQSNRRSSAARSETPASRRRRLASGRASKNPPARSKSPSVKRRTTPARGKSKSPFRKTKRGGSAGGVEPCCSDMIVSQIVGTKAKRTNVKAKYVPVRRGPVKATGWGDEMWSVQAQHGSNQTLDDTKSKDLSQCSMSDTLVLDADQRETDNSLRNSSKLRAIGSAFEVKNLRLTPISPAGGGGHPCGDDDASGSGADGEAWVREALSQASARCSVKIVPRDRSPIDAPKRPDAKRSRNAKHRQRSPPKISRSQHARYRLYTSKRGDRWSVSTGTVRTKSSSGSDTERNFARPKTSRPKMTYSKRAWERYQLAHHRRAKRQFPPAQKSTSAKYARWLSSSAASQRSSSPGDKRSSRKDFYKFMRQQYERHRVKAKMMKPNRWDAYDRKSCSGSSKSQSFFGKIFSSIFTGFSSRYA